LRLRVTAAAESIIRSGHPWVFSDSVREQNRAGNLGELAVIYDRQDKFLAVGLFDPNSPLRVRVLHAGKPQPITETWWRGRLKQALDRRAGLFDASTTGYRCLHGESDGWPGLVLDRYHGTFVLKLYTAAWLPSLDQLIPLIREALQPERLVLRLSRNIQEVASAQFGRAEGQVLFGPPVQGPIIFLESGIRFEAEVIRGQKTGFFLDQRENRRRVEGLAAGRDVLNVFSFSGGFSLYAARGEARSVTDVDISAHALESARRNFALNTEQPGVRNCAHQLEQADAFAWLEGSPRPAYDLIILDPPSLARRESERAGAIQAYRRLATAALSRLRPRGVLVAASCSAHVSAAEFFQTMRAVAQSSGRQHSELGTELHPPDHPAGFKEAEYLKSIYLRFEPGAF
jgi:23S rRNA (cytosine1962-C5)-methyltransferase